MRSSVIMTTYNSPAWLEKVLVGFGCQTLLPDEVVIADDGSRPDTAEVVARQGRQLPFRLVHVWQPDQGFRKCQALNHGVLAAHLHRC